jgi:hypothetical protein
LTESSEVKRNAEETEGNSMRRMKALVATMMATLLLASSAMSAQPSYAWTSTSGTVTGTTYYTKGETRFVAETAAVDGAACSLVAGGMAALATPLGGVLVGGICVAIVAEVITQAQRASDEGRCIKVKHVRGTRIFWVDTYSGSKYCH